LNARILPDSENIDRGISFMPDRIIRLGAINEAACIKRIVIKKTDTPAEFSPLEPYRHPGP